MANLSSSHLGVHGYSIIIAWRELSKRYARDKDAIEATWRAMGVKERETMILESVDGGDNAFPRDAHDRRFGINAKLNPEMNLKHLVTGDNLLKLMEMRALTPIHDAHVADINLVRDVMRRSNMKLAKPGNGVYEFIHEDKWGQLYEIADDAPPSLRQTLLSMGKGYAMVTEDDGRLVIERQSKMYEHLRILADDIMEHKRELENPDAGVVPRRKTLDEKKMAETLRQLDIGKKSHPRAEQHPPEAKVGVKDLRLMANEQYETIIDHVQLLRNEPQYLANVAEQHYFFSTPDIVVPDEHGNFHGSMMEGSYCVRVVKDVFGDAFEGQGLWNSITALVSALGENPPRDSPLTKELWSLCLKELNRSRLIFKRMLQADRKVIKFFVRQESGIHLKVPINVIEKKNRYLAVLIGVARTEFGNEMDLAIAKALKELYEMEEQVPRYREDISGHVGVALGDVAVITAFMAKLRAITSAPKQPTPLFVKSVESQMSGLKKAWEPVDLEEYAVPIARLTDPGMAQACYAVLEQQVLKSLGVRLDQLFDSVVERSLGQILEKIEGMELQDLNRRYKLDIPFDPFKTENQPPPSSSSSAPSPKPDKVKTRGLEIAQHLLQEERKTSLKTEAAPKPDTKIAVRSNALKTFKKLFRSSSAQAGAGIPWSAFLSAMTALGFSAEPLWGSVCRFSHERWGLINIHRPHPGDSFEGFAALRLKARLARRFGWSNEMFVLQGKGKKK